MEAGTVVVELTTVRFDDVHIVCAKHGEVFMNTAILLVCDVQ